MVMRGCWGGRVEARGGLDVGVVFPEHSFKGGILDSMTLLSQPLHGFTLPVKTSITIIIPILIRTERSTLFC